MGRHGAFGVLLISAAIDVVVNVGCGGRSLGRVTVGDDAGAAATAGQRDAGAEAAADREAPELDSASAGHGGGGALDAASDGQGGGVGGESGVYSLTAARELAVPQGVVGWLDAVAVADVTGDARSDAVVLGDQGVFVFAQQADGTLGEPQGYRYPLPPGSGHSIAVLDLDRNGWLDVVIGHHSGLVAFASDGAGRLLPGKDLAGQPSGGRMRIMDVDLDRIDDLVAIGNVEPEFVIWYGDGAGGIREKGLFSPGGDFGPGFTDFTLADLTGDGIRDIAALTGNTSPRIHAYSHDAQRGFQANDLAVTFPLVSVDGIEAGDLGGDSRSDLFVTERSGTPGHLWVIRQSAAFERSPAEWLYEYQAGDALVVHDLDRDGDDDVLVKHGGWLKLGVYLQSGGALQASRSYAIPSANASPGHHRVAVGDLSGDRCTDVAIADTNHGLIVLYGRDCVQ